MPFMNSSACNRQKIIYITCSMPYGSAEEFIIAEVKEMLRKGMDIIIVPRSAKRILVNLDAKELLNITLQKPLLSMEIFITASSEALKRPRILWKILRTLFNGTSFVVLLKNLYVLPKSLWLARLAKDMKCTHIHAQWGLTTSTMAMVAGRLNCIPWSFTVHRGDIAGNNLLKKKIGTAAFVRFISKSGLEMAKEICSGEIVGKIHTIHMGVKVHKHIEMPTNESDIPVLLCPAKFIPVKGHKYLLEAFAILKRRGVKCALYLAGKGKLKKELKKQARTLNITKHVKLLGQVPHNQLMDLYKSGKASIVILPSIEIGKHVHEGIPVSLMEAMSYGTPCISTTTGGIPELLGNGAGILVPPREPFALADAIENLLQDEQFRKRTVITGYRRVMEEYNIEKNIEDLISLIYEI